MDLLDVFLTFLMLFKTTSSLRCYQCQSNFEVDYVKTGQLRCEEFTNATDRRHYEVECEYSTMCFKKETTLEVGDKQKLTIIERGCASQTMNGDQELSNHKWVNVKRVYEVYPEGCSTRVEDSRLTTSTECYCRTYLCNNTDKLRLHINWTVLVTLVTILNCLVGM